MQFYICNYADYPELPQKLFTEHTPLDMERKNNNGTKFISRCKIDTPTSGFLFWMNGTEPRYTHDEILIELQKPEWNEED